MMAETSESPSPQALPDPWVELMQLNCVVTVDVPVPKFTIRELLRLDTGSIVETRWKEGTHLPLQINGRQIGWVEFEVIGDRLAVQVTGLI
jgi:flagellar motor switch protein FliN/FliY